MSKVSTVAKWKPCTEIYASKNILESINSEVWLVCISQKLILFQEEAENQYIEIVDNLAGMCIIVIHNFYNLNFCFCSCRT